MKLAALIFEIVMILVQMYHNYWLVEYSSGLANKFKIMGKDKWTISPKKLQAWLFCGIIDVSIIFAVTEGIIWWSVGGILVLFIMNCMYVYNTYEDFKKNKNLEHKNTTRRKVVAYFIATLVPVSIYVFAYIYSIN